VTQAESVETALRTALEVCEGTGCAELLQQRANALKMALWQLGDPRLSVAVIGITSSGKSAFLNALLGEKLLPEQCQPTTNCRTLIRRGPLRFARITFKDERETILEGELMNADTLLEFASEDQNPRNCKLVEMIEVESPACLFDDRFEFLDTPGLDAFGHDWHQTLTLEEIVPQADLVIYMVSVRNAIHRIDLKALGRLVEHDQRVLFVISGKDLERDDTEVGRIVIKREAKLKRQLQRLRIDAKKCRGLKAAGFALVDSKLAQLYHLDRRCPEWAWCGFDEALKILIGLGDTIQEIVRAGRIKRASRHARTALRLVEEQLAHIEGEDSIAEAESTIRKNRIGEITGALECSQQELRAVEDPRSWADLSAKYTLGLEPNSSKTLFADRSKALDQRLAAKARTLHSSFANVAAALADNVRGVNLEAPRQPIEECPLDHLPSAEITTITRKEARVKKRGWGWRPKFWPHEVRSDVTIVEADVNTFQLRLAARAKTAVERLSHYRELTIEVLRRRYVSVLEDELERLKREHTTALERLPATNASHLRAARAKLDRVCARFDEISPPIDPVQPEAGTSSRPSSNRVPRARDRVFAPMLMGIRELGFHRMILRMAQDAGTSTGNDAAAPMTVGIAGLSATDRWRFVDLLLHQISTPQPVVDGGFTLVSGSSETEPNDITQVMVTARLLRRLSLLVSPDDEHNAWSNRGLEMFQRCPCKFVLIDGFRIGHALSRLAQTPYQELLGEAGKQIIYVISHGAAFDSTLERLALVIRPSLHKEGFGPHPIFVHEGYDVRYTHLLNLAGKMGPIEGRRYWRKSLMLSTAKPFDVATIEDVLEQCYRRIE